MHAPPLSHTLRQTARPAVVFITSFTDGMDLFTLNPQEARAPTRRRRSTV